MWTWLALIGTPLLCLTNLSLAYALVGPSCEQQTLAWLHAVHGACTVLAAACALLAWRAGWRAAPGEPEAAAGRRRLLHAMAGPMGALFTLVLLAQWLFVWVISPCQA